MDDFWILKSEKYTELKRYCYWMVPDTSCWVIMFY